MGFGQSQRNIADDIYDGAFKDLVITSPDGERVYCDNRLHGWELYKDHLPRLLARRKRNLTC
ncbi:hypothetical protein [Lactobacillus delbrueckii]|uniref:hypothetical protein n=1 Tax=Lactobacillus delbrueckii TaxID=1584 RepID=UPI00272C270D|nr:hypothetical protein [Lactobacillus delbrueckii]WKZ99103.1 hypothetical protein MJT43_04100 [Lactobacillus delbrueckii]